MAEEPKKNEPLAVTVVSGFLGAGKTTLLKHVLNNQQGMKVAVIVNDMSTVNIDAQNVKRSSMQSMEKLIELQNGCICCTLRDDLMIQIAELAISRKYDYLVVESSGVAEPIGVAETFTMDPVEFVGAEAVRLGIKKLSDVAKLDTMVTVIDGFNFPSNLDTKERAKERWGEAVEDADDRNVSDLLTDQVEFANVILVNKMDLLQEDKRLQVRASVRALNTSAKVIETSFSKVALEEIINTKMFNFEEARNATGWLQELRGEARPPETEEYGISSMVYRRRRPFHPKKFHEASSKLTEDKQIVRSKGFVWLATRNDFFGDWNQSGAVCSLNCGDYWFAEIPEDSWGSDDPEFIQKVKAEFDPDPRIGDRRQELVVIGIRFDTVEVERLLDSCLLTEEEYNLGPEKWKELSDPFEIWDEDDSEDEETNGQPLDDEDSEDESDEEYEGGIGDEDDFGALDSVRRPIKKARV